MAKKSTGQRIAEQVKAVFPDAYHVLGVGWCGPDRELAAALERDLSETYSANCEDCGAPILPEYSHCDRCARTAGEN